MAEIDLIVYSRVMAQRHRPVVPTAYISIYTPGDDPAEFEIDPNICGILKLAFDDYDDERFNGLMIHGRVANLISEAQAIQIKLFVEASMSMGISTFLIHCDAGVSRSCGVAVALNHVINGDTDIPPRYVAYNRTVASKVRRAFLGNMVEGQ